jgi:hypothetical protein
MTLPLIECARYHSRSDGCGSRSWPRVLSEIREPRRSVGKKGHRYERRRDRVDSRSGGQNPQYARQQSGDRIPALTIFIRTKRVRSGRGHLSARAPFALNDEKQEIFSEL